MTVALFLDVDDTLTSRNIQGCYAEELGCFEEYEEIEQLYQKSKISSKEFALRIIELYGARGLHLQRAREIVTKIDLQSWTDELLKLDVEVHLVSNGPSYYIESLAEKYQIPPERVICSTYHFEGENGVISRCDPIDEVDKADFVRKRINEGGYTYSIGVGDSPLLDGPFIAACSIGFLIETSESHFFAPNFQTIIRHVKTMVELVEKGEAPDGSGDALHLQTVPAKQLFGRLTVGSWILLLGSFGTAFALGAAFGPILSAIGFGG